MLEKLTEPEKLADEIAERIMQDIGRPKPIQKLRNSQFLTAILGASGLALFLVGVEKIFYFLSGWQSVGLGILLLTLTGALFVKLK